MLQRVLMVATVPSMIGQFNMNNIKILLDMGCQIDVAADFTDTSVWPIERVQHFKNQMNFLNIRCIQLDFSRNPLKLKQHVRSYKEAVKLISEREYSFIHTHTPIASAIIRLAAKRTKTKVIYTAHGFHFYKGAPLKNWIIFYPIEKFLSKYTDVLITINNEDYKRASEKFNARKTVKIPGVGVDTDKFATCKVDKRVKCTELGVKKDDFLLLSVGELSEIKNQKVVIDALKKMKLEGTLGKIVYLAVGKGNMQDAFIQLIKSYDLEDHVKLLGFRTDIDELCEIADCFVHLSIRKGLEIAPLEAMAAGLPFISANERGIRDYTENGPSGCCVNLTSVDEMVKAIVKMRDDDEFRNKCAVNNFQIAKALDIRKANNIMPQVYRGGYKHLWSLKVRQQKREEFGLTLDDIVIISVGELNDNKNHQVIIESLKTFPPNTYYFIVGTGILKDQLRMKAKELGLSDRVFFTGYRNDIKELLWMADCFAFPSKREGLGIAALEAMSAGLPIIGHDIGGIRDFVISGKTGWLCNCDKDYLRFIDTTIHYSWNKTLISQEADKYDVKYTNEIMRELYFEILV